MGIRETIRSWLFPEALPEDFRKQIEAIGLRRDYREGKQKKQLLVKPMQFDDNITVNYTGLIVDKSISLLFGKGIEMEHPSSDVLAWLQACWDANKQEILLHRMAEFGSEDGTVYVKLVYDPENKVGIVGKDGVLYPRMVLQDPMLITIQTEPNDFEQVVSYTIEYSYIDAADDKEVIHKQVTKRGFSPAGAGAGTSIDMGSWTITDFELRYGFGSQWRQLGKPIQWPYPFAPIIHWQNLPQNDTPYGKPDITEDLMNLQNKVNFTASNIAKIIRLHAHPQLVAKNMKKGDVEVGPDKIAYLPAGGELTALEMQSDLVASSTFLNTMTQAMFNITQSVNISSTLDKVGALTNFGLRVLYQDAARIGVKRELYGDAIIELNRRLCILAGQGDSGGEIHWPEMLPENGKETSEGLQLDLDMGILDKESAAEKKGYDWVVVQKRLAQQKEADNADNANIADLMLQNFNKGFGVPNVTPPAAKTPVEKPLNEDED